MDEGALQVIHLIKKGNIRYIIFGVLTGIAEPSLVRE